MKALLFILLMISSVTYGQEQLTVRVNEKGLLNIMSMAIKYNTSTNSSKSVVIPQNIYKFTIKQKDLAANPIVQVVNDISNLNLNKNLDFYLHTSDIKVTGVVDQKSLKTSISNSNANGFDVKLSINLSQVSVSGANLSLCEDRQKKIKKCGSGLKTTVSSLKINTTQAPVSLNANLRVSIKNNNASVKVLSVTSNLESAKGPSLDINFASILVPKITIVINDQETELDTSRLKDEILKRKALLASKLLGFLGDFVASDLAEMINVYLANAKIATDWEVYRSQNDKVFDEFHIDEEYPTVAIDNTYVRPPVLPPAYRQKGEPLKIKSMGTLLEEQVSDIIRNAVVGISLRTMTTPQNKDIQLGGLLSMVMNGKTIKVQNRLGNQAVESLPVLDLSKFRTQEINLAISEPVINGALDLVNETGLFQELFDQFARVKGFSIRSAQIHFAKDKSLKVVANVQIDLREVASNGVFGWLKKQWAAMRETNNNNSKIYFPLEISVNLAIVTQKNGTIALSLFAKSPFNGNTLINSFNYPSNFENMKSEVKSGVIAELKKALGENLNKAYVLDVTKFMNQSGVSFKPKSISIEQGAYLLINLDIENIKFSSKNPKK